MNTRFPYPDLNTLPQDMQARILEVQEKAGFIPNVFLVFARRPAEWRALFAYHDALMLKDDGNLSRCDREMIVTATSALNQCLYRVGFCCDTLMNGRMKPRVLVDVCVHCS